MAPNRHSEAQLQLKAGEWVEVRSTEEILATLDERGCLENMPFMPEMLKLSGQKFRVVNRADKTCDPANTPWSLRRLTDSVHLEGVRCDGADHGGCQAGCLIFWKEAWLKRADTNSTIPVANLQAGRTSTSSNQGMFTISDLLAASQKKNQNIEPIYFCQATEVRHFTSSMKWWDLRQDLRDIRSGNLASGLPSGTHGARLLNMLLAIVRIMQALVFYVAWGRYGIRYPAINGQLAKTPVEILNLQPGEIVQVRSKDEIVGTLDKTNRNRGLLFDTEMVPFCGGFYRVLRRVDHIIDEKTGKMMIMKFPCIILEGVWCRSDYHRICPRAIYSYWRENWLRRVASVPSPTEDSEIRYCEEQVKAEHHPECVTGSSLISRTSMSTHPSAML